LVLGDANVSTTGGSDLDAANRLAREMVYRCGFSSKLGPVSLMDQEEVYLNRSRCALMSFALYIMQLSDCGKAPFVLRGACAMFGRVLLARAQLDRVWRLGSCTKLKGS